MDWSTIAVRIGRVDLQAAAISEAVIVPDQETVELIVGDPSSWGEIADGAIALKTAGWSVTVVTAVAALGRAHLALGPAAVALQGCWYEASEWRFSGMEIA